MYLCDENDPETILYKLWQKYNNMNILSYNHEKQTIKKNSYFNLNSFAYLLKILFNLEQNIIHLNYNIILHYL